MPSPSPRSGASGLPNRTDAMLTTVEGEWDEVMAVVKHVRRGTATELTLEIVGSIW